MMASGIATAAGGGLSAYTQYQQGQFSDQMSKVNQGIAEQNAVAVERAGADDAEGYRRRGRQVAGQQATALAAGNLDMSGGTALDLLLDTARGSEMDAQTARYNAQMEARGIRIEGRNMRMQGRVDRRASRVGAGATILGSAGSAAGQYGTARYYRGS